MEVCIIEVCIIEKCNVCGGSVRTSSSSLVSFDLSTRLLRLCMPTTVRALHA